MNLFNRLFKYKRRRKGGFESLAQDGQYLSGLPKQKSTIFEDYLFGDFLMPGTHAVLPDYAIGPQLTNLYAEIDNSLNKVFAHGSIDEYNADMFDNRIASALALTLRSIEHQYADTSQTIQIAVSKRQSDTARLERGESRINRELDELSTELMLLKAKQEKVNFFTDKRRGKNEQSLS